MGFEIPKCTRCAVPMNPGTLIDFAHAAVLKANWHEGEPGGPHTFLGIQLSYGVSVDKSKMLPISGFRCPNCGMLELYAR